MTKIKICGLKRPEDIQAVNEAKPDFAGFVIEVSKSRRNVSAEQVRELVKGLAEQTEAVGVFVNAPLELVAGLLKDGTLALAQLHGGEDEAYIRELRQMTDKPLIQAFSIRTKADIERALQSTADYLLLDQGDGGTGRCFDWSLVPELSRPFFLAGGLSVVNLSEAISQVKPWAVDLSSSLETDGVKDPAKIQAAVEMVRTLETGSR
ncbi:phosphoribosylanthranilate isomerase [Anaerosacchariphilus sp. NSJ-68]|uniref:N-(5'-phosphoribosyl)anthranilate isomerase n=2 Tax=Lachnospiraceae TaxID=186803 RepID=A0A923LDR9_9FIRM|nr:MULTISPECIES: phosphoribosylanthranilate isomerase [Lachnospiraceae]MBC5660723.1 phosphoribosylanthranilate isomerase [Anaerosacchariphilus hominis]MBC5697944.1 phosphoribosylanthranilate isomerase [Roseburia difficilis]